ncbi:MAG: OmpA family, partial [Pseudomonadota bacterium]
WGYGERYPIEHKRKNNFRSKRNRRVEVLFFDPEESPNLGVPPENSTVFDDAVFTKVPLPVGGFEPLGIRYAFLPTEHTEKRSFPKPSCLPLLRRIVDTARQSPSLKVVVVGHTDHLLADDDNEKLSLARADAVKALITHDLAFFKRRFEAADPLVPWDFEEVQWMLHALSSVAGPFYVGETDGHAGYMTRRALGAYQLTKGMNVDNGCDVETLEALCKDYLALIPEALEADRIRTVAGGSWTPRLVGEGAADDAGDDETAGAPPEGNLEVPSFNGRVEVFLFERPVVPAAESIDPSTRRASPTYRAWARRADPQEVSTPVQYAIRLMDGRRVPVPGVPFKILRLDIETGEFADFSSGSLDAFGTTSVKLPPGPYRVDFSLGNEQHSCGLHSHVDHSAGLGVRLRGAG